MFCWCDTSEQLLTFYSKLNYLQHNISCMTAYEFGVPMYLDCSSVNLTRTLGTWKIKKNQQKIRFSRVISSLYRSIQLAFGSPSSPCPSRSPFPSIEREENGLYHTFSSDPKLSETFRRKAACHLWEPADLCARVMGSMTSVTFNRCQWQTRVCADL